MERSMAWAQHRRGHSLSSVAMRDKDEDLALFKDMGKREKSPFLRTEDALVDHASILAKFGGLSHPQSAPPAVRRGIGAELLNSDADKTDYDWLMTPPGTPLFPSLDADAPALQHGSLINRSLAAIKTSRQASTAPRARSPAPSLTRGNPSPSRRPSTPQRPQTPSKHPTSTSISTRPATPTRSSTPSSYTSPQQPRPSTPTRQPSRPVTPLGARPATPTRRSPTPATTPRPSTPTLRRSTSSPTGSRNGGSGSHIRNPSPTRSTASSATSVTTTTRPARGLSPARGPSPARGLSPSPSSRGRSPSPSLRAPYPVDASDDIPPNLRTTSDRPSSAQRRAIAYGANPGEGVMRRTPSPARSVTNSVTRVERVQSCRGETSDSESSFDTGSQSGVSAYGGLVTPERRRMLLGHGTGVEYGKASSGKGKRSGSATSSPQMGGSASKKSFESAAREYHRGQVAAFRPLMTNSSISTFYSSRASGLLRRPLTPSSTCSSSEHGATVAHDSDEDAGSVSQWKPATKTSSGAHSPLHLFNKSVREASTLDASMSIVDDNDELSNFFRTPEALQVECMSLPVGSHCKVQELESPKFGSELNWLNSREAHELDREYLKDFDGAAAPISKQDGQHSSSGLEKIRDKLRHLKRESNEDNTEPASRTQENNVGYHEVELPLHRGASCEDCGHRKRTCQCTTTTTSSTSQAQEVFPSPRNVHQESSSRTDPRAANAAYAKEKDIWYIYRHSSEYEVPVAGFSETKMEIDPPQILAKEIHMRRPSPSSVSSSPPTVYIGKGEYASRNVQKENVKTENHVSTRLISGTGNVTGIEEFDEALAATDVESKRREFGAATTTTIPSVPELQNLKQAPSETGRATYIQSAKENAQISPSIDNVSPEAPPIPTPHHSSAVTHSANTIAQSFEGSVKKLGSQEKSEGAGQVERGDRCFVIDAEAVSPVNSSSNLTEEQRSPEFSSSRSSLEEAREQGPVAGCITVEAHCVEDHVSVIPQVKKIIWQEEDLQQLGTQIEAATVLARGDEKERTCREGDEVELGWENGKVEDAFFDAGHHPDMSVEIQRQVAHSNGPIAVKPKTTHTNDSGSYCFEPLELVGQKCLLTGEVHIDSALYGAARFSDDSLVIKVQSSDGRVLAVDNPARLISEPQNEKNSYAVFEYSHWAEVGARLTLSAHSRRGEENSSSEIIFYPREHQVHVTTDEKQPRIPEFQGRPQVYAKGTVVTALDVTKISAVSEKGGVTGGLKSGEKIAVTCSNGVNVAGPLHDDFTPASIPSSRQRNLEPLLKTPEAKAAAQSRPDVPSAKTDVQEVQRVIVTSHNGDLPQEVVDTYNAGSSTDEFTGEHFDYSLDSKRNPRRAQPALPEVLMPSAEITNSGIVKPSSFNGVNQSTYGSESLIKEKTPSRNQSRDSDPKYTSLADADIPVSVSLSWDSASECTSRADSELAARVSQNRDSTTKYTPRADAELPVLATQSWEGAPKYTFGADAELPVGEVNESRDTNSVSTSHGDSGLPVGESQSRNTILKSTSHVDFVAKAKASLEAPVKEEIVESADSPSPGTTRKHMSSFKFSHKKTGPSELKRSNTTFSSSTTKIGTQPAAIPGSKRTMMNNSNSSSSDSTNINKVSVNRKPASPQLNKGRSVRAPSPARPSANAKAAVPHVGALPSAAGGANGEMSPEEPSIHSRFSNITVRSGSDTEIFDWGPSSLEETSSRCGSSSGPNAASVAVLSRSSSLPLEDVANGRHRIDDEGEDDEDDDEAQTTSPSPHSSGSEVNSRDDGIQGSPSSESTAGSSAMTHNRMHPSSERVRPHHDSTSTVHNYNNYCNSNNYNSNSNNSNQNYAPKQNLDKLSEKLEQLETFGARVLLRNPQQQFLRSPPSHGNHSNSKPALVGHYQTQSFPLVSCRSSRSLGPVRFGGLKSASSPVPDKCRCTIL